MRVALATAAHLPHGSDDDQVLIAAMRAAGLEAASVIWDRPAAWGAFDAIIIRSVWDYHLKYPRFVEWLNELDRSGVPIHNNTEVVRWNADKRYMLELAAHGVAITPSRVVSAGDDRKLAEVMGETGWHSVVIKPTVSSTGYETWFVSTTPTGTDEARFADQKSRMDVLVQEFAEGVHAGELSLVFLAGRYSHAVLKRAAGNEFRVHIEHGGTVESVQPDRKQIEWAEGVMRAVTLPWTYARVDAVMEHGRPILMELELLDPELFFAYERDAAQLLISSITPLENSVR